MALEERKGRFMNTGTRLTKQGQLAHLKTLSDVVAEYEKLFQFDGSYQHKSERSVGHHDPVIDVCKEATGLEDCVVKAVDGKTKLGKTFSEGSCVRTSSKLAFADKLIDKPYLYLLEKATNFEQVYDLVRNAKPWGIGNLTVYNVAARIAAYKGIHPEKFLYLHAGPLQGWKRLTGCKGNPYRVPVEEVPKALRALPIHRIEDSLCEMRDFLHPGLL
jgi:hypothetical protein